MSNEVKSAEQMATEIKAAHAKALDEVKAIAEQAIAEAKKGIELSTSLKEKADEGLLTTNELKTQLTEIEQKLARRSGPAEQDERKSLGEIVVENEGVKSKLLGDGASKRG